MIRILNSVILVISQVMLPNIIWHGRPQFICIILITGRIKDRLLIIIMIVSFEYAFGNRLCCQMIREAADVKSPKISQLMYI